MIMNGYRGYRDENEYGVPTSRAYEYDMAKNLETPIISTYGDVVISSCPSIIGEQGKELFYPGASPKYMQNELNLDIEALADKLWEKLNSKPAIIPCPYCKSHNAVTNPTCVQCGAPLGGWNGK